MAEPRDVAEAVEAAMLKASTMSALLLACGEMTAQERRTAKAVAIYMRGVALAALRSPSLDRDGERMGFDILAKGLLAIAERPSSESAATKSRIDGLLMGLYDDGFDAAARSRAQRAYDALSHANIVRPLTGEVADRYRALPLAHEEKAGC
ncbi:hypothetical protein [Methylobacterium sp. WL9]|uniref:hypothetical protein n=1 Tax=Methylobacterium sp. WL9 TaxID=2603898 RepID=UPI0011CB3588|nr:hypothetical protein [Methylobacterium sp. WL9]TXN24011.1 hypothetical protein FV217_04915 [Methylobacterium sp. WL9]